jgi:uncharacterized protein YfaP (DUF2135 family)
MRLRVINRWLAVTVMAVALACSRDSTHSPLTPSPSGALSIADIAASASTADTSGVRNSGPAPSAGAGPRISASANGTVINGGTLSVAIASDAPFNTVYMFVGGKTLGVIGEFAGALGGHYEIRLPAAQTETVVLLTFPQDIPLDQFDLQFAVADPSGAVGPYTTLSTTVIRVGTGDVQVTLSWDRDSDVDLHVIAPGGDEIYYGRPQSPTGGTLDLDSNAGCEIDGVRNENITWPTGRAPRGQYSVRVDYWSSCGVNSTHYTVRVNNGGSVQVVEGSFTGPGDQGGPSSGRIVASFERLSGPTAAAVSQASGPTSASQFLKKLVTPQPHGR